MIEFSCPGCGTKVRVKDDAAGKRGKCPKCGKLVTVPAAAPKAPSISPPQKKPTAKCPACGAPMADVLIICPKCGANRETGLSVRDYLGQSERRKTGIGRWLILAGLIMGPVIIAAVVVMLFLSGGEKNEGQPAQRTERSSGQETPQPSEAEESEPKSAKEEKKPRRRFPTDIIMEDYLHTVVKQPGRFRDKTTIQAVEQCVKSFWALEGRFPKSLDEVRNSGYDLPQPPDGAEFTYDPKTGKVGLKDLPH